MRGIFGRNDQRLDRPLDAERRVIPADAPLISGAVELRHLIEYLGVLS